MVILGKNRIHLTRVTFIFNYFTLLYFFFFTRFISFRRCFSWTCRAFWKTGKRLEAFFLRFRQSPCRLPRSAWWCLGQRGHSLGQCKKTNFSILRRRETKFMGMKRENQQVLYLFRGRCASKRRRSDTTPPWSCPWWPWTGRSIWSTALLRPGCRGWTWCLVFLYIGINFGGLNNQWRWIEGRQSLWKARI
jgi:hypothetical protein